MYTGNYNSDDQLSYALKQKIMINIDSSSILPRLLQIGTPNSISFRINPGIGGGSHSVLVFGGKNTKFGMSKKDAVAAYRLAKKSGVEIGDVITRMVVEGDMQRLFEKYKTIYEMPPYFAGQEGSE